MATDTENNILNTAQSLAIIDDWDESDRAKVNIIADQAGVDGGAGAASSKTLRVLLASDAVVPLPTNAAQATAQGTSFGKMITYVIVEQGSAGTTQLLAGSSGNKHKVMGCVLSATLAGTIKFTDGAGDITGTMPWATNGGFVLPTGLLPYFQTSTTNTAISIVTATGAAHGIVAILTEP